MPHRRVPAAAFVGSGGAKDLSNLLNSYARLEYRDAAFFAHLAGAARRLHATKALFGAQAIANIMNAAVRLGFAAEEPGQDLVLAMAQACMHVRPAAFDTQALSLIINALAKSGVVVPRDVLDHLLLGMADMPRHSWTAQAVGITVNGLIYQRPYLICLYAYMRPYTAC